MNTPNNNNSTMASDRPMTDSVPSIGPSSAITVMAEVASNRSSISLRTNRLCMVSGAITAAAPRTRARLLMFDPTTLPKARSVAPRAAPTTLTTSSGALVPKATSVSATIMRGTPCRCATADAPRTSSVPPPSSNTIPTIRPAASTTNQTMVPAPRSPPRMDRQKGFARTARFHSFRSRETSGTGTSETQFALQLRQGVPCIGSDRSQVALLPIRLTGPVFGSGQRLPLVSLRARSPPWGIVKTTYRVYAISEDRFSGARSSRLDDVCPGLTINRSHGRWSSTFSAVLPMNARSSPRRDTAPMTTMSA